MKHYRTISTGIKSGWIQASMLLRPNSDPVHPEVTAGRLWCCGNPTGPAVIWWDQPVVFRIFDGVYQACRLHISFLDSFEWVIRRMCFLPIPWCRTHLTSVVKMFRPGGFSFPLATAAMSHPSFLHTDCLNSITTKNVLLASFITIVCCHHHGICTYYTVITLYEDADC